MKSVRKLLLVAMSVGLSAGASAVPTLVDANLTATGIRTSGPALSRPTAFIFLDGTSNDLLISEQATGQVKRMTNGVVSSTIALDLAVNLGSLQERGLLSLIADPSFAINHYVYVYYTPSSTSSDTTTNSSIGPNHIVARYTWNGTTGLLESRAVIQGDLPDTTGPNHNGGVLVFGPPSAPADQQKLFIVIGDLNRDNKNENFLAGGAPDGTANILRVNSDGTIPTDNPFYNVAGANSFLQRTYAYGVRNSFGLTFDELSPAPNNLWDTENGLNSYDEINFVAPAFNSGWQYIMGPISGGTSEGGTGLVTYGGLGTYSDPEFSFVQPPALTAIQFFKGARLGPAYVGDCFVGDNNNGRLYKFEMNGNRTGFTFNNALIQDLVYNNNTDSTALSEILFGTGFNIPSRMVTGPDGRLYISSLGDGQIYRIENTSITTTPTPSPSPSPTSSPSPTESPTPSLTPTASPTPSPSPTASPSPSPNGNLWTTH